MKTQCQERQQGKATAGSTRAAFPTTRSKWRMLRNRLPSYCMWHKCILLSSWHAGYLKFCSFKKKKQKEMKRKADLWYLFAWEADLKWKVVKIKWSNSSLLDIQPELMTADFLGTPILWSQSLLQIKATELHKTRQLTFLELLVLLALGRGDNFLVEMKTTELNKGFLPLRTAPCKQKWTSWYVSLWRCCWCSPVYCWGYSRARERDREH